MGISSTIYKKGNTSWNKGKKQPQEVIKKISKTKKKNGAKLIFEHNRIVLEQIKLYEDMGYKCVNLTNNPIPDFMAVKDGKVYAIEVQRHGNTYHCTKYLKVKDYSEVIWIIFRKPPYSRWRKNEDYTLTYCLI